MVHDVSEYDMLEYFATYRCLQLMVILTFPACEIEYWPTYASIAPHKATWTLVFPNDHSGADTSVIPATAPEAGPL